MSRTILALISLTILAGCQTSSATNHVSLVTARIQSIGPSWSLSSGPNGGCDDCIPHRPFTHGYHTYWDDLITRHTAQRCAFRAFDEYRNQCGRHVSHHFKMGFIRAYEDLALNQQPRPPIVPPPLYWNAYYRSCAGKASVNDWFAGYDAGLDMGSNSGVSRFHEVYLRRNGCVVPLPNPDGYGQPANSGYEQPEQFDGGQQTPTPQELPVPATNSYNVYGTANPYRF